MSIKLIKKNVKKKKRKFFFFLGNVKISTPLSLKEANEGIFFITDSNCLGENSL